MMCLVGVLRLLVLWSVKRQIEMTLGSAEDAAM